jgi:hypothetical protein
MGSQFLKMKFTRNTFFFPSFFSYFFEDEPPEAEKPISDKYHKFLFEIESTNQIKQSQISSHYLFSLNESSTTMYAP